MALRIPRHVLSICATLRGAGYEAYVVGGGVRDALLGRDPQDWDVATNAPPWRVQELFPQTAPTGLRFGTVTVLPEEGRAVEVTTFRGESGYVDGRRPTAVQFVGSIEEDLIRRDFTINAIAYDPLRDAIVDPHDGQADLAARRIRAVGNPDERFREDGLRLLRAVRLAVELGFDLEPETAAAVRRHGAMLEKVSRERIGQEWRRILLAPQAGRGLALLYELELLSFVLPGAPAGGGAKALVARTAKALNLAPECGFAAKTAIVLSGLASSDLDQRWLAALVYSKVEARAAQHLADCLRAFNPAALRDDASLRRFLHRLGRPSIEPFFCAACALQPTEDIRQISRRALEIAARGDALAIHELAVDGHDVRRALPGAPGPAIGQALQRLLEHVLQYPEDNSRERLLALLTAWREQVR